ncbi:MAG: DUF6259 domain-containing protein [bacterium]
MRNGWFMLSHKYSTASGYDREGLAQLGRDLKVAERLDVECVVLESYLKDFKYGDYTDVWSDETLRAMVDLIHERGMKAIPYTNLTEVDIKSSVYREHGDWLARPPVGREYSGFISCYLPDYYEGFDFVNKLVCPASGWRDHYLGQCGELMERFGFDGVYVDRTDFRVPCRAHPGFAEGIVDTIGELQGLIKSKSPENLLVLNDSFRSPDRIFRRVMEHADIVLTEILPPGTNQDISNIVMFLTSDILQAVKPLTEVLMKAGFRGWSNSPVNDTARIARRVRLLKRVTGKPVWVCNQAVSAASAVYAWRAAVETGENFCVITSEFLENSKKIQGMIERLGL